MIRASIVIPVHGRASLTERCLATLLEDPPGVPTELIVVDDASPDRTLRVLDDMVASGAPIRVLAQPVNLGFAAACNRGASSAAGEHLVFLNNDTVPTRGWLDALVDAADDHPDTAAFGSKLLFPDGTVQHAGLVFGADRNPHHVYAGFPADHPAVNRPRELQAVTGACLLVRRDAFLAVGGFDEAYQNGHEDVDLCLRLRAAGERIRYCPDSVVTHLESVSRGRRSASASANSVRYRDRWADAVRPDDLEIYVDDALLSLSYGDATPLRLEVSPLLATLVAQPYLHEAGELLRLRAEQVADLLRSVTLLLAHDAPALTSTLDRVAPVPDPDLDDELAEALAHLQLVLVARSHGTRPVPDTSALAYRRLVRRVRRIVHSTTPVGSTVAVLTRGDDALVTFSDRVGWHFPRDAAGTWIGHHPAHSSEALAALDEVMTLGATHLVVPAPSRWWLDHYRDFGKHLRVHAEEMVAADECTVYSLTRARATASPNTEGVLA
jgi:GT2 family glycosyltransferase